MILEKSSDSIMSKKQLTYIIQHEITSYLLAYLMIRTSGMEVKSSMLVAAVVTLRDFRSLIDNIYGDDVIKSKNDIADMVNKAVIEVKTKEV